MVEQHEIKDGIGSHPEGGERETTRTFVAGIPMCHGIPRIDEVAFDRSFDRSEDLVDLWPRLSDEVSNASTERRFVSVSQLGRKPLLVLRGNSASL